MKKKILAVVGALGFFSSTMSVVLLVHQGVVSQSWVGPFETVVVFWDWLVGFVLTWVFPIGPMLAWLLETIARSFGWAEVPVLNPHWKHVFVLLMTIFGAFTKKTFEEGDYAFGAYGISVGIVFASLAALISGVIPVEPDSFLPNFFVAFVPAVCFWATIYIVWLPKNRVIGGDLRQFLVRAGVASLSIGILTFWLTSISHHIRNVGILCLLGFVMVVALLRLHAGYKEASKAGTPFIHHPITQRGLMIIAGFSGAAVFSVLNAGWALVGN